MEGTTEINSASVPPPRRGRPPKKKDELTLESPNTASKAAPGVIELRPLRENLSDLLVLKKRAGDTAEELREKIRAVAEQAGLKKAVVRKLVNAKATDFTKAQQEVEQLSIVFNEIDDKRN